MNRLAMLCAAGLLAAFPQEAPDEEKETKAEVERPEVKPKNPVFLMKDGSRITARFDLKDFRVETFYGVLTVPIDETYRVIFGKVSDPELVERIRSLIEVLGDASFEAREEAMEGLRKLGRVTERELREAAKSEDPEVKQRAAEILEEIDDGAFPEDEDLVTPEEDTIVAARFTIRGKLLVDSFSVLTGFGPLEFKKKDIRILYVRPPDEIEKRVKVSGVHTVNRTFFETGVKVSRGSHLRLTATGMITVQRWGNQAVGPDGNSNWGRYNNQFTHGALVGRIGKAGPLFLVGRHFADQIDREGELFLGLALNDSGENTGEFKVLIQVRAAIE